MTVLLPLAERPLKRSPGDQSSPMTPTLTDRLMEQRILVLGEEVTDESANRLVAQLLLLSAEDPRSDISLYINSPGGSVQAGLAVYDTMQLIPNDVATLAMGFAASMGQVLLCAGSPGKRFALPNAEIVMHEGSAGIGGSAADVEIQAAHLRHTVDRMRRIIAHHTGRPLDQVVDDVGRDRWFDAEAALEYGFVDHIVTSLDDVRPTLPTRRIGLAGPAALVAGGRR
jgi:ATP-dependent Clp protease protease subunit